MGDLFGDSIGEMVAEHTEQRTETSNPETVKGQETNSETAAAEWQKDNRYVSGSWKSPDDIYKSYRDMEKEYSPLKEKYTNYSKTLEKHGISDDSVDEVFQTYKSISDQDSPLFKSLNFLYSNSENPEFQQMIEKYISDKDAKELEEKIGRNVPEDLRNQMMDLMKFKESTEAEKAQQEEQRKIGEVSQKIDKNIAGITDFIKENDVSIYGEDGKPLEGDELTLHLLEYFQQKGISPEYMVDHFIAQSHKASRGAATERARLEMNNSKKAIQKDTVPVSKAISSAPAAKSRAEAWADGLKVF